MNFLPTACAAALLAFLLPSPGQDGDPAGKPPTETSRTPEIQQLIGAWRLTDFETKNLKPLNRQQVGYLLVGDGFLSLECHIGWMDDDGRREASTFFSGTHSYTMRSDGVLELASMIGTTMDPLGSTPVFEPIGRRREYKARFVGAKLVLVRETDLQKFTFEKIASAPTELDFYGRRRKPDAPKSGGEPRPEPKSDGEPK